jgi:hypothetical protein
MMVSNFPHPNIPYNSKYSVDRNEDPSMKKLPHSISRNLAAAALLGLCARAAMATLGQNPLPADPIATTPPASGASIKAAAASSAVPSDLYKRTQVQLASGTVVNEYVNASGIVFAVTWGGPVLPNLNNLLGDYFKAFMDEAQHNRSMGKRGAPVNLTTNQLVVTSNGRMGHFSGYAYVPALTPTSINITDLLP